MITFVGVHGVGTHLEGRLLSSLQQAIADVGYESIADEAFWSDLVKVSESNEGLFSNSKRLFYSIRSLACEGFSLKVGLAQPPLRAAIQVLDIGAFGFYTVFSLLIPIALLLRIFNAWFSMETVGPAAFLDSTRALEALLWGTALAGGCLAMVSGIVLQFISGRKGGGSRAAAFGTALKLSLGSLHRKGGKPR